MSLTSINVAESHQPFRALCCCGLSLVSHKYQCFLVSEAFKGLVMLLLIISLSLESLLLSLASPYGPTFVIAKSRTRSIVAKSSKTKRP